MKYCRFLSAIVLFGTVFYSSAQETVYQEKNIIYNRETAGIIHFNSSGGGFGFRQTYIKDAFKSSFFEVFGSYYWDIKEESVSGNYGYRQFKYGKLNEIFFLKGAYGNMYNITRKPDWGGVELQLYYSAGASLCLALPVYLYIKETINDPYYTVELEKYDPEKHIAYNILGRGPFFEGIAKIKPYPGLYGNIGLYFEYGQFNRLVKAIELGLAIDIYPIGVPIMAFNDPKNIFFSFYFDIIFGRRYNK